MFSCRASSRFTKLAFERCLMVKGIASAATNDLARIREEFYAFKGGSVTVTLGDETGIAKLCLSHPEKRNALTGSMMVEFADAVTRLDNWTRGKGVILYSPGDVFCSGADLAMVRKICTSQHGLDMSRLMHDTLQRFLNLPLLSVALVQGSAIGGGAELATAADFRLTTAKSSFQFSQKWMGVTPGWGGGTRLVKLIGPSKALDILTSCRKVLAEEALHIGLVSAVLKTDVDPMTQAHDWLSSLTKGHHQVVRTMKQIVASASSKAMNESLNEERELFATLWGGQAQKEALELITKGR